MSHTANSEQADYKILSEGDSTTFVGSLTVDSLDALQNEIIANDSSTLIITTGGGDAERSIAFGNFIRPRSMTLIIDRLCFSSCANYLVPAANNVIVRKDAILGWHGGAH